MGLFFFNMKSFNLIILFLIKLPLTRQDSIFQPTEKSSSLQGNHSEKILPKIQNPLQLRKQKSIRHLHLFPRKHKALNKHLNLNDEFKPWNFGQLVPYKRSKIVPRYKVENVPKRPRNGRSEGPVKNKHESKSYPATKMSTGTMDI